jgi:hypothetical protein
MYIKGKQYEGVDGIKLVQNKVQWWAFVNTKMKLQVP